MIASLAILSVAVMGMAILADNFSRDTKGNVTSSQMRTFGEASKAYIKDNYAAIQAIATSTSPALIDVSTLIAAGKLPTGFLAANAYGQSMCTLVLEPAANRLQAMVIAEGGATIEDLALGSIASTIGGSGGGVYAAAATTMRGAIGGWSLPLSTYDNLVNNVGRHCDGTAGNISVAAGRPLMALWFENGDTSAAFLSKDLVVNRPDLNTMTAPLVMGSVQSLSAACTQTGAIAQDGTGSLISCQAGIWAPAAASSSNAKCVASSDDLNSMQTDGRCYSGRSQQNSPGSNDWIFTEVFRNYASAAFSVQQRVVGMTGSSLGRVWQRTQQSGSQTGGWSAWVQQADSQVSIGAGGTVTAAGSIVSGQNITASGKVTAQQGNFSGDGIGTCCSNNSPSLTVSENTNSTGRLPSVQFNASGKATGRIELDGTGTIQLKDDNNANMKLRAGAASLDSMTSTGTTINTSNDWSFQGFGPGSNPNVNAGNPTGSANVNDIWIRSLNKWGSQLGGAGGPVPYTNFINLGNFNGSKTWTNNLGVLTKLYAYGGSASNCGQGGMELDMSVGGYMLMRTEDKNAAYVQGSGVVDVPAGYSAYINSDPFRCSGNGLFYLMVVY